MASAFSLLLLAQCLVAEALSTKATGYLYQPAYALDHLLREPAQRYHPKEGDLVFFTEKSVMWWVPFTLALAYHPYHSGIVFKKPNGEIAIVEAGPYDSIRCEVLELLPRLRGHHQRTRVPRVWIRRRKTSLTAEQSGRLTKFALEQDGKSFAVVRIGGQLTPFRSRGPIKTRFLAKPTFGRRTYMCSEMVMEALVVAGLVDACTARPAATYPRDMFLDRSINPYINKHLNLSGGWHPPQRWMENPVAAEPACKNQPK